MHHLKGGTSLPSYSEGSAYPNEVSSIATLDTHTYASHTLTTHDSSASLGEKITANIADAEAANKADGQRGESWALPGRLPALCWSSKARWLLAVDVALLSDEGRRRCRALNLSLATARIIARACAGFADSLTGRHLTASNQTIGEAAAKLAGRSRPWCHDVVANTRRVLKELGLAVEVARGRYLTQFERLAAAVHHEGTQIRAASTWVLTMIRRWESKSYLPRRGPTGSSTPRRRNSPNARTRAKAPSGRSSKTPRGPRSLAAQIVTAHLVQRAHGLDNGSHLGSVIDVIDELVDCERWTGRDLAALLDDDARTNPRDWPTHITHPAAFLRHRLSGLAVRLAGPSPSQIEAAHHQAVQNERRERAERATRAAQKRASSAHVAGAMAQIREQLARRRSGRDASATRQG